MSTRTSKTSDPSSKNPNTKQKDTQKSLSGYDTKPTPGQSNIKNQKNHRQAPGLNGHSNFVLSEAMKYEEEIPQIEDYGHVSMASQFELESLANNIIDPNVKAEKVLSKEDLIKLHNKNSRAQGYTEPPRQESEDSFDVVDEENDEESKNEPNRGQHGDDNDDTVEASKEKLERMDLGKLKITKKQTFDMRQNITKEYLALCYAADEDPVEYYKRNYSAEMVPNTTVNTSVSRNIDNSQREIDSAPVINKSSTVNKTNVSGVDESQLKRTKTGNLDMRYNVNKEYVASKIAEAKDKMKDLEPQLKRKADGSLDGRFKVNKEYMELLKQCDENYYLVK